MHTVKLLIHLVEHHQTLAYSLTFIGMLFEGEFFLISTGVLAHLGALNLSISLVTILSGAACKTLIGYYIGTIIRQKWQNSKFVKYIVKRAHHLMPQFKKKPFWSIFISKFIMGSNNIMMIFSGYIGVDRGQYIKAEAVSTLLWAPSMLLIGFFFSYTALLISREVWSFSMIVIILVALFFIFDKFISWLYELFENFYYDVE